MEVTELLEKMMLDRLEAKEQKKRGHLNEPRVWQQSAWILVDSSFSFLVICEEFLKYGFVML